MGLIALSILQLIIPFICTQKMKNEKEKNSKSSSNKR